jgi:rhodanese-related sulfurtransferase
MARITVQELRQLQESGGSPIILDLRAKSELELDPAVISGAIHLDLNNVAKRSQAFPPGREIIVYCSCPNEVTSARVALQLHRKGFTRVRPLLGGIDAWRKNNFPIETWKAT